VRGEKGGIPYADDPSCAILRLSLVLDKKDEPFRGELGKKGDERRETQLGKTLKSDGCLICGAH